MSEFYSLINYQTTMFLDLIPISLNISAVLNRDVSGATSSILRLIIIVRVNVNTALDYQIIKNY